MTQACFPIFDRIIGRKQNIRPGNTNFRTGQYRPDPGSGVICIHAVIMSPRLSDGKTFFSHRRLRFILEMRRRMNARTAVRGIMRDGEQVVEATRRAGINLRIQPIDARIG